jgi:hypothetical protein
MIDVEDSEEISSITTAKEYPEEIVRKTMLRIIRIFFGFKIIRSP